MNSYLSEFHSNDTETCFRKMDEFQNNVIVSQFG